MRRGEEKEGKGGDLSERQSVWWWKDGSQFLAGPDIQGRRYRGLPPIISAHRDPPRPLVDEESSQNQP
jgi:hypothetical protein